MIEIILENSNPIYLCSRMLARPSYLDAIQERFLDYPIVALPGPRQAGKTTLARAFSDAWEKGPVHFFDLEAPLDRRALENPTRLLSRLRD